MTAHWVATTATRRLNPVPLKPYRTRKVHKKPNPSITITFTSWNSAREKQWKAFFFLNKTKQNKKLPNAWITSLLMGLNFQETADVICPWKKPSQCITVWAYQCPAVITVVSPSYTRGFKSKIKLENEWRSFTCFFFYIIVLYKCNLIFIL